MSSLLGVLSGVGFLPSCGWAARPAPPRDPFPSFPHVFLFLSFPVGVVTRTGRPGGKAELTRPLRHCCTRPHTSASRVGAYKEARERRASRQAHSRTKKKNRAQHWRRGRAVGRRWTSTGRRRSATWSTRSSGTSTNYERTNHQVRAPPIQCARRPTAGRARAFIHLSIPPSVVVAASIWRRRRTPCLATTPARRTAPSPTRRRRRRRAATRTS